MLGFRIRADRSDLPSSGTVRLPPKAGCHSLNRRHTRRRRSRPRSGSAHPRRATGAAKWQSSRRPPQLRGHWLHAADESEAGRTDTHNTKAFMPFGAGPRFCPGRQLAMLQIKMVIAMLCRDFEVKRPKDAPAMEDVYQFVVGPTHVYTSLSPRRSIRGGIDIEFREKDRRTSVLPIGFPERRVAERRKKHTASAG